MSSERNKKYVARHLMDHAGEKGLTVAELAASDELLKKIRPNGVLKVDEGAIRKGISRYLESLEEDGYAVASGNGERHEYGAKWRATDTTREFIEGLDYALAFAVLAADDHLAPALPPKIRALIDSERVNLEDIAPDEIILENRVRFVERGPTHLPIATNDPVLTMISEALYKRDIKRISVRYSNDLLTEKRQLILDPLAIVVRKKVSNLIAYVRKDESGQYPEGSLRHFKIHLIEDASLTGEKADKHESGALDTYLTHMFGLPAGDVGKINLSFRIQRNAGTYLIERPLCKSQTYKEDGNFLVFDVNVANTQELRWWLMGFGSKLEVLGPENLREEMKVTFRDAYSLYAA